MKRRCVLYEGGLATHVGVGSRIPDAVGWHEWQGVSEMEPPVKNRPPDQLC